MASGGANSSQPTIDMKGEIVEFDLDRILDMAVHDKPRKPTSEPPGPRSVILDEAVAFDLRAPVKMNSSYFSSVGIHSLSPNVYSISSDQAEIRAGINSSPLLAVVSKKRGGSDTGVLISVNITEDQSRTELFDDIRFITHKVKKCKSQFCGLDLRWLLELNPRKNTVRLIVVYKISLRHELFRHFSPDISVPMSRCLGRRLEEVSTSSNGWGALENTLSSTHALYTAITAATERYPLYTGDLHNPRMLVRLLRFQRTSVAWMLSREGVTYDEPLGLAVPMSPVLEHVSRLLLSYPESSDELAGEMSKILAKICFGWKRFRLRYPGSGEDGGESNIYWANFLTGNLIDEPAMVQALQALDTSVQPGSGLLCEEMGLGKTVEVTQLVLTNPRPPAEIGSPVTLQLRVEGDFRTLKKAKTTLIAAPESILRQWYTEIGRLCPSMTVTIYRGLGKYPELNNVPKYIAEYLLRFDVVLMNYTTMLREMDYANYSSRHAPTRGGQKRMGRTENPTHQEPSNPLSLFSSSPQLGTASTLTLSNSNVEWAGLQKQEETLKATELKSQASLATLKPGRLAKNEPVPKTNAKSQEPEFKRRRVNGVSGIKTEPKSDSTAIATKDGDLPASDPQVSENASAAAFQAEFRFDSHTTAAPSFVAKPSTSPAKVKKENRAKNGVVAAAFQAAGNSGSKKYDRLVLGELAAQLRHEDLSLIPHTHYYELPLMLCQWWRVVLDEVQMVSSGVLRSFKTAALIPRFHSWGVSGTPPLLGAVLQFLRIAPFDADIAKHTYKELTEAAEKAIKVVKTQDLPQEPDSEVAPRGRKTRSLTAREPEILLARISENNESPLLGGTDLLYLWLSLSMRHTKAMVHDDISLPPQHRVLLTIPFTKVEQDKYDQMYESALEAIGLSSIGAVPAALQIELTQSALIALRSRLVKLRQLCGNSQIGYLPKAQASRGRNKNRFLLQGIPELKTLGDVLDDMIDAAVDAVGDAEKGIVGKLLDLCSLLEFVLCPDEVVSIMNQVLGETSRIIKRISARTAAGQTELNSLRSLLSVHGVLGKDDAPGEDEDEQDPVADYDSETEGERAELQEQVGKDGASKSQDLEFVGSPKSEPAILPHKIDDSLRQFNKVKEQVLSSRLRLRSWRLAQHRCFFLLASAHFQLYDPEYSKKINELRISFGLLLKLSGVVKSSGLADISGFIDGDDIDRFHAVKNEEKDGEPGSPAELLADFKPETGEDAPPIKAQQHKFLELVYYSMAEECRKDLLQHTIEEVNAVISKRLSTKNAVHPGDWINDGEAAFPKSSNRLILCVPAIEIDDVSGLVSDQKSSALVDLVLKLAHQLNTQAAKINNFVARLHELLLRPLLTTEKSPDGEEYENSIQDQDQASCLLLVISQLLMDRSNCVLEQKTKITEIIKQQDKDFKLEAQRVSDRKYLKLLQNERVQVRPIQTVSFEEYLQDARLLESELPAIARENLQNVSQVLRVVFENEKRCIGLLQKTLSARFNAVFNARVEYFKQLQQISDSVEAKTYSFNQEELSAPAIDAEFDSLFLSLAGARNRLVRGMSRYKYLTTLGPKSEVKDEDEVTCIICQLAITTGSLTSCGHRFCKVCLEMWLARSSTCPVCKAHTTKDTVHYFTHYKADLKAQHVETSTSSSKIVDLVYQQLDKDELFRIQRIGLTSSYGSKVDLIVKQVLYLRSLDADVQIVIFSQWQDLLVILAFAFDKAGITYVSAKGLHVAAYKNRKLDPVEEFKDKTSLKTCFLLNAQAQASGLTLINAKHIFLCEPLINTPTELQAISRIHRIGQTEITTAWMFAIENSVEEKIVLLGTRKRLEYLRANARENHEEFKHSDGPLVENELRAAESFALTVGQAPSGRSFSDNSELVADADLKMVYFG